MVRRLLNKIESILRYRYLSSYEDGAYKFLLKKVYKSTDISFIEKIWQLDYFREILEPVALDINKYKKVLVLAPHQDDEVIGCGGTLLKLTEKGTRVTIGFLTDGEELSNPGESIVRRDKESEAVGQKLGAEIVRLGVSNTRLEILPTHITELTKLLNSGWDAVFTVWPVDQPPKHRLCAYLFGKALAESDYLGSLLLYSVHTDLIPNKYVDITNFIQQKQELIALYPSQLNAQCYQHLSKGLDAWRSRFLPVSPDPRYIETIMEIPAKAYSDFMEVYRKTNNHELFKGDSVCIDSFNRIS